MLGDNICQIGYWQILLHPDLMGSVGASYTKPGQLLFLGIMYELSNIFNIEVYRIIWCLVMALCIYSLVNISIRIGGNVAGTLTLMLSINVFLTEFFYGSFSIFLIPISYFGIWLYYYSPKHKAVGRMLLLVSIQFHIIMLGALVSIIIVEIFNKNRAEVIKLVTGLLFSIVVWVLIILRIQGTINRISGGEAAGYFPVPLDQRLFVLNKAIIEAMAAVSSFYFLLVLILIGVLGCVYYDIKKYLIILASILVVISNSMVLGGSLNFERFFALIYAFGCSVGIAVTTKFILEILSRDNTKIKFISISAVLLMMLLINFSNYNLHLKLPKRNDLIKYNPLVEEAITVDKYTRNIFSKGLITEDDYLYPLIILNPKTRLKLIALQKFNVSAEADRVKMLHSIDHIIVSLKNDMSNYLFNIGPYRKEDKFREEIVNMLEGAETFELYGFRFNKININDGCLIVSVSGMSGKLSLKNSNLF